MAIGPGLPGAVMEAFSQDFPCGLVGTIGVTIDDGDGNTIVARTTANIVEISCVDDAAVYRYLGTYPTDASLSPYVITWDDTEDIAAEEILVSDEAPAAPSGAGPCTDWVEAADISLCCEGAEMDSDNAEALENAAAVASQVLWELSGRRFSGLCGPVTARPCRDSCSCWGGQRLEYVESGGDRWIWGGDVWRNSTSECGCGCVSSVLLSGYPVQGIAQVKIDGEVLAPSEYELRDGRNLIRKNGGQWPACQDLTLDDDEEGTFSVSYWYGETPSALGIAAATQLACEFYKLCAGSSDCRLPSGTTRVSRQGVVIERSAFVTWGLQDGVWVTGIGSVDAFLNAYNPGRATRKPMTWSPDGRHFARPVS